MSKENNIKMCETCKEKYGLIKYVKKKEEYIYCLTCYEQHVKKGNIPSLEEQGRMQFQKMMNDENR